MTGRTDGVFGGPQTGQGDVWLARYDSAGNRAWVRQFGTSGADDAYAAASDGSGGVYLAGKTDGSLGGPTAGPADAWLARYDGAGNQAWVRQLGTSGFDGAYAAAPDGAGGVYVGGETGGSLGGPNTGSQDVWLARYDSAGNQTWIRQFGSSSAEDLYAAVPDGAGGVYVCGSSSGSFGGPHVGARDAWLARFDGAGNQLWIRQFGTTYGDRINGAAPDGAGGVFVTGYTSGNLAGSVGGQDCFLARYGSTGNQAWVRQFGSVSHDEAFAAASAGVGGVYVAGLTNNDFGGPPLGGSDAFLAAYGSPLPACYANCDGSTTMPVLNVIDFVCFLNKFAAGDPAANCDQSTTPPVLNINDFTCFLNAFAAGCS